MSRKPVPETKKVPVVSSLTEEERGELDIPLNFKSTSEIEVPKSLIEQVIGQDTVVELVRKASLQKRNVLLIGVPGIGKSMLAQAMAEILPVSRLYDILVYPNEEDQNNPKVRVVRAGEGKQVLYSTRMDAQKAEDNTRLLGMLFPLAWFLISYFAWTLGWMPDVVYAATLLLGGLLIFGFALGSQVNRPTVRQTPKLLIDNIGRKTAPFSEATGARAGALLGDVRHDPLQSGGLGTPAHLRVEPGLIHRSSGGVLFLDEIATLSMKSQQELLTAMQEKKYPITGQSEMSSGAMTRTEAVPCFPSGTIVEMENGPIAIDQLADELFSNAQEAGFIKKEGNVDILDLNIDRRVWVPTEENVILDRLERVYRRPYSGKLVKITLDDGTILMATPEHPIQTPNGFVEARGLQVNQLVETVDSSILDQEGIIGTYDSENQRVACAYLKWKGNKGVSHIVLGVDPKTIHAWEAGAVPRAIQCVNWLVEKKLLPLHKNSTHLSLLARLSGALYGDGGLSRTGLYFTTDVDSRLDLESFKSDILSVFGNDLVNNFVVRRTESANGEGLELALHHAYVSRFFRSLGIPFGDKVAQSFVSPKWINGSTALKKEFFSSLLSCELYGRIRTSQDTPRFVMAKIKSLEEQHLAFLGEIRNYLSENGVLTGNVVEQRTYLKKMESSYVEAGLYTFSIHTNYLNMEKFSKSVNVYYASRKRNYLFRRFDAAAEYGRKMKVFEGNKKVAVRLKQDGVTNRAIQEELHISQGTILKTVGPTYNRYTKDDKGVAKLKLNQFKTIKDLAHALGIPYTTVLFWKRRGFQDA
ncbi:MAG: sigma 54-interacting transcriptional regulator [archaeon]